MLCEILNEIYLLRRHMGLEFLMQVHGVGGGHMV